MAGKDLQTSFCGTLYLLLIIFLLITDVSDNPGYQSYILYGLGIFTLIGAPLLIISAGFNIVFVSSKRSVWSGYTGFFVGLPGWILMLITSHMIIPALDQLLLFFIIFLTYGIVLFGIGLFLKTLLYSKRLKSENLRRRKKDVESEALKEGKKKFCIHCGAKIRAVSTFCDICGKKQDE